MDSQTEKLIVENVLNVLLEKGIIPGNSGVENPSPKVKEAVSAAAPAVHGQDGPLTLTPKDTILIASPHNPEALKMMRKATPARIAIGK